MRDERFGRAYAELRRPARAMVRRAFGSAFADDEIEDFYGNAWLGTIRALEHRHEQLSDEELRRYVLAAVANQASRELRRRGRKPTTSIDVAGSVADPSDLPEDRAARDETKRLARDVLSSLPSRRRAVLMLRYGWGLEPHEVRALVKGLSPRAYRKEITRGVHELAEKLRMAEGGEWCATRQPVLDALAAGTADEEQRRQARQHLAHCRHCADHVGNMNRGLHELGSSVAVLGVLGALNGGSIGLGGRAATLIGGAREAITGSLRGGAEGLQSTAAQIGSSGSIGAGTGGAGIATKLAGAGAVSKAILACAGTGAAASACVAAVLIPGGQEGASAEARRSPSQRAAQVNGPPTPTAVGSPVAVVNPATSGEVEGVADAPSPTAPPPPHPSPPAEEPEPASAPPPASEPAPQEPPPVIAEFEPTGTPPSSRPSSTDPQSESAGNADGSDFGP